MAADVGAQLVTLLLVLGAVVPALLTNGPPPDPTNAAGCLAGGGECLDRPTGGGQACHRWQRPFPGICGPDRDCCFIDDLNHSLRCGLFAGDCAAAARCGRAPRYKNAYCPRPGDVCCIWLI